MGRECSAPIHCRRLPPLRRTTIVIDMATSALTAKSKSPAKKGGNSERLIIGERPRHGPQDRGGGAQLRSAPTGHGRAQGLWSRLHGRYPLRVLSGANWGPFAPPFAQTEIPNAASAEDRPLLRRHADRQCIDKDEFKNKSTNGFTSSENQTCSRHNGPLIPGDPEREAEAIHQEGIR